MAAGALSPGPDLVRVDVVAVGVGPQVADGALDVDDLVRPVGPWARAGSSRLTTTKPLGDQGRADAVDDEAAGVVVARDPGAAVDVDDGGDGAVQPQWAR